MSSPSTHSASPSPTPTLDFSPSPPGTPPASTASQDETQASLNQEMEAIDDLLLALGSDRRLLPPGAGSSLQVELADAIYRLQNALLQRAPLATSSQDDLVLPPTRDGASLFYQRDGVGIDVPPQDLLHDDGSGPSPVDEGDLIQLMRAQLFLCDRFGTRRVFQRLVNTLRGFSVATELVPKLLDLVSVLRQLHAGASEPFAPAQQPDQLADASSPARPIRDNQIAYWQGLVSTLEHRVDVLEEVNKDLTEEVGHLRDVDKKASTRVVALRKELIATQRKLDEAQAKLRDRSDEVALLDRFGHFLQANAASQTFDSGTWSRLATGFLGGRAVDPVILVLQPISGAATTPATSASTSALAPSHPITPGMLDSENDVVVLTTKRPRTSDSAMPSSKRSRLAAKTSASASLALALSALNESEEEAEPEEESDSRTRPSALTLTTPAPQVRPPITLAGSLGSTQLVPTNSQLVDQALAPLDACAIQQPPYPDRGWVTRAWDIVVPTSVSEFGMGPLDHSNRDLVSRNTMGGWGMQKLGAGGIQTPGFPSGTVTQARSWEAFVSYGAPHDFDALMTARLWDEMWIHRATRFYIYDPHQLDNECLEWLKFFLFFQFQYRQAAWDWLHWLHIPSKKTLQARQHEDFVVIGAWLDRYNRREALNSVYGTAYQLIVAAMPKTFPSGWARSIWFEPGLWFRPSLHVSWAPPQAPAPATGSEPPIVQYVRQLDRFQPLRTNYAGAVGLFYQTLSKDLAPQVLENQVNDVSWELPEPYSQPDAFDAAHTSSMGSPGSDYYNNPANPWAPLISNFDKRLRANRMTALTRYPLSKLRDLLFPTLPDGGNQPASL